ncbi:MAG: hypothetical protein Q8930_06905 [Bacillota bacterium]|nr:hypothetical protein [Bacillota bacterium]
MARNYGKYCKTILKYVTIILMKADRGSLEIPRLHSINVGVNFLTRRYYIIFFIISFSIVIASSTIKISENKIMAGLGRSYNAESLQQLVKDSPLIIVGEVTEKKQDVKVNKVKYILSEVRIMEALKENMLLNSDVIGVMQMNNRQDPVVKQGEKVLLFLEPYGDTEVENGYVCVGLCQGYYRFQKEQVVPSASIPYSLKRSIEEVKNIADYIKIQAAAAE